MLSKYVNYNRDFLVLIAFLLFFSCKNSTNETSVSMSAPAPVDTAVVEDSFPEWLNLGYVCGNFNPDTSSLFAIVPDSMADRSGLYLRKEALAAFRQMRAAAQSDGINLIIRSATRNFTYQKGIWEAKWTGQKKVDGLNLASAIKDPYRRAEKILLYSSMPGTSRHHWGTDIDLNAFNNNWFTYGKGLKLFRWLGKHAAEYGFCRPYTDKANTGRSGYEEEKWHWSYMPIAEECTAFAEAHLRDTMINGFKGDFLVDSLDIVKKYVLGISEECMNN